MMEEEHNDELLPAIDEGDWYEQVDANCDMIVLTTNQIVTERTTHPVLVEDWEVTHALDAYVFGEDNGKCFYSILRRCTNNLTNLGVIPDLAMKECCKEINSRRIDPTKEDDWNAGKLSKWPKDKAQADTYKANYELCRTK